MGFKAHVVTEDSASGAQVIDGSLKFDDNYLTRTPGSEGNLKSWTWSAWVKPDRVSGNLQNIFEAKSNGTNYDAIYFTSGQALEYELYRSSQQAVKITNRIFRDTGWYHLVVVYDAENSTADDRVRIYVNGERETSFSSSTNPDTTDNSFVNDNSIVHQIGDGQASNQEYDGRLSQVYLIDGQALDASYFGFTDGLTNTWRPKKYEGTFGTNGFYLPMDGNTPIGKDQSGNGNDWTPVNFGGSAALDKATGALPILNTVSGGNVAAVGVRTDASANNLVLALPLIGNANDESNQINSGSTTKTATTSSIDFSTSQSNFYGGSAHFNAQTDYITLDGSSDFAFGTGDFTIESWVYPTGGFTFYDSRPTSTQGIYPTWEFRNGTDFRWKVDDTDRISEDGAIQLNTWSHVAVVRSSGTTQLYVNGVATGSSYSDSNNYLNGASRPSLAGGFEVNYAVTGYRQDFRVYKGLAKYTQNFIPASTNPDILPDSPSGVSGSSKLAKYPSADGGSTTFGKRTSKLTNVGDFAGVSGTGDYTVSFWFYANEFSSSDNNGGDGGFLYIFNQGNSHPTYPIKIDISKAGKVIVADSANFAASWYSTFNNAGSYDTDHNVVLGKWNYVHVYRESGTLNIYNNGGLQLSVSQSNSSPAGISTEFCTNTSNVILKDLRITNTAITDATPPTSPLTAVSGTQLLICHGNGLTDISGNTNTLSTTGTVTDSNFNPFTTDINTVRGQETGYATWNPLSHSSGTLSGGNLTIVGSDASSGATRTNATIAVSSGKWYFEVFLENAGTATDVGIAFNDITDDAPGVTNSGSGDYGYLLESGQTYNNNSGSSYGSSLTTGDTFMCAFDVDTYKLYFGKNGIWFDSSNPVTGSSPAFNITSGFSYRPVARPWAGGDADAKIQANFGQKPFKFSPPDGFQPLNNANLPRPTKAAVRPDKYFGAVIYDGDGGTSNTVTGLSFKPDLVWGKCRTGDTLPHNLFDVVRGFDKQLDANDTAAEVDRAGDAVTPLSNGFILDATYCNINNGSTTNVAWCWKRSIEAGFDIVTHTNTNDSTVINHNLGKTPEFIITKCRTANTTQWRAHHVSGGVSQTLILSTQEGYVSSGERVTAVSDTTFTYDATVSANGNDFIHYVWTSVPGFSKFGSYTGNGSADGPFVHCGFKPAWVMVRRTDSTSENWYINDSTRDPINVTGSSLMANQDRVEATTGQSFSATWDMLSNGFKFRDSGTGSNTDGVEYAFMAFAEAPTNNLYGAQTNAR